MRIDDGPHRTVPQDEGVVGIEVGEIGLLCGTSTTLQGAERFDFVVLSGVLFT